MINRIKLISVILLLTMTSCSQENEKVLEVRSIYYSSPNSFGHGDCRDCDCKITYKPLIMEIKQCESWRVGYQSECNYFKKDNLAYIEIKGIEIENNAIVILTGYTPIRIYISKNNTLEYKQNFRKTLLKMAELSGAKLVDINEIE